MKKLIFLFFLLCASNIYGQNTELLKIESVQQLPKDFQDFFQQFTQSRETQIALIKTPLIEYNNDYDDTKKERRHKKNLKEYWEFLSNDFFIENTSFKEQWCGYWRKTDEAHITYIIGICEAGFSFEYYFRKIKNKWFLAEIVCNNF
jgi:hypothetical protein